MFYLIVLLLLLLIALLLNALYKRTNHFNNQFVDVKKYWKPNALRKNLDVVNLGSNHPKFGFDYSECKATGENLAIGPQTFEYDFAVLRHNIGRLKKGATVLIPVCLLNFFLYRQENRNIHLKYYTFLPAKDIVGYSMFEKLSKVTFPLLFNPKRLRFLIKDVKKDNRLKLEKNPNTDESFLLKDAQNWLKCWEQEFSVSFDSLKLSDKNKNDIQKNIEILQEMLAYCKQNNLNPVITILPVTKYLSSQFSEEFIQDHIFAYIEKANTIKAPVLNYLKDERFTTPEYYINSFFMNRVGAKMFTKEVMKNLNVMN